jgi:hypothetical protein
VRRAEAELPRQGTRNPWKNLNDYYRDVLMMRRGAIEDDALRFTRADAVIGSDAWGTEDSEAAVSM